MVLKVKKETLRITVRKMSTLLQITTLMMATLGQTWIDLSYKGLLVIALQKE